MNFTKDMIVGAIFINFTLIAGALIFAGKMDPSVLTAIFAGFLGMMTPQRFVDPKTQELERTTQQLTVTSTAKKEDVSP